MGLSSDEGLHVEADDKSQPSDSSSGPSLHCSYMCVSALRVCVWEREKGKMKVGGSETRKTDKWEV